MAKSKKRKINKKKKKNEEIIFTEIQNDLFLEKIIKSNNGKKKHYWVEPISNLTKKTDTIDGNVPGPVSANGDLYGMNTEEPIKQGIEFFKEAFTEVCFSLPKLEHVLVYIKIIGNNLVFEFTVADIMNGTVFMVANLKDTTEDVTIITNDSNNELIATVIEKIKENDGSIINGMINLFISHLLYIRDNYEAVFKVSGAVYNSLSKDTPLLEFKEKGFKRSIYNPELFLDYEFKRQLAIINDTIKEASEGLKEVANGKVRIRTVRSSILMGYDTTYIDKVIFSKELIRKHNDEDSKIIERFKEIPRFFNEINFTIKETDNMYGSSLTVRYIDETSFEFISSATDSENNNEIITVIGAVEISKETNEIKMYAIKNKLKKTEEEGMVNSIIDFLENDTEKMIVGNTFNILVAIICLYSEMEKVRIAKRNQKTVYVTQTTEKSREKKNTSSVERERSDIIKSKYNLDSIKDIKIIFAKGSRGIKSSINRKPTREHNVTGFWRHYKSGKKVWINPFKRGSGEKVTKEIIIEE